VFGGVIGGVIGGLVMVSSTGFGHHKHRHAVLDAGSPYLRQYGGIAGQARNDGVWAVLVGFGGRALRAPTSINPTGYC